MEILRFKNKIQMYLSGQQCKLESFQCYLNREKEATLFNQKPRILTSCVKFSKFFSFLQNVGF